MWDGKQIYHHFSKWEDYKAGMWRTEHGDTAAKLLKEAIAFTGNADLYGKWMIEVLNKWPIACEHNLSNISQNRQAWIGHAACCMAIGCTESITRSAWGMLSDKQREDANKKADIAIRLWETQRDSEIQLELFRND